MKIYIHKAILYILIRLYPRLFERYFEDYVEAIVKYGKGDE